MIGGAPPLPPLIAALFAGKDEREARAADKAAKAVRVYYEALARAGFSGEATLALTEAAQEQIIAPYLTGMAA